MMIPNKMTAVHLTGHGNLDKLVCRNDVPVPKPQAGEVLIRVEAAGVNNTDINTRLGWYSKSVENGTNAAAPTNTENDASWSGTSLNFPLIQGADCCGHIVAVGQNVPTSRIGERVIVRNMLRSYVGYRPFECWTFGSEVDGAFAQFAKAPSRETYRVNCDWNDAELASIPCAYSTAENMLDRAYVSTGETVLVTGASGGVGTAAIQLARRRGARVVAIAAPPKSRSLLELGASQVVPRDADPLAAVGTRQVDVVIDVVGGEGVLARLETLKPGGRYAIAGAIAGPLSKLDLRTVYLRDISILGCTFQEDSVFENLVSYIERGEIRPIVSKTYPLAEIAQAQKDFLDKSYTGKLILIPPQESSK